jgi:hypothetical protein
MTNPMTEASEAYAGQEPFAREEFLDKPGIVGARWWQRSLEAADKAVSRRKAVQAILIAGGVIAGIGVLASVIGAAARDDFRYESRAALDTQKEFGWSFGATTESLTFDGVSKQKFDRDALARLADDLRPALPQAAPWYVPTLFQSVTAVPRSTPREQTTAPVPLKDVLVPISTPAMDTAYRQGKALAALFKDAQATQALREAPLAMALVVVDLPGPEAVAFAAGAASSFVPVFAIDNWPHPRGVVPAHQALAAAAYYQPLFAKHGVSGAHAAPMIVLDRRRLNAYTDDATQFDNRHVARVPGAQALKQLGISHVLYVTPTGTDKELDDLNDDFVLYARAGLDVKVVGADAFAPDANDGAGPDDERPIYYYGGSIGSNGWFWRDYPWARASAGAVAPSRILVGANYVPVPRQTPFSSGAPGPAVQRPRPSGFGTVPVVVSVATGLVLGAKLWRSGSWNRSSGGSGG